MNRAAGYFHAPWARALVRISALGSLLLVGIAGMGLINAHGPVRWLATGGPLAILALTALFTVRGYQLAPGWLRVRRLLGWTRISLNGLRSAEADAGAIRGSLRVFGNGGLFSFSGWYWNRRLGRYRMLLTDPERAVILRWADRIVVVSPDRPGEFVNTVRALAGSA